MEYDHHIFISYRRRDKWPEWVLEHFVPLLSRYVSEELDTDVRIFVDQKIEMSNSTWPLDLAKKLAHSATLIPLWSRSYFRSIWCVSEFAHMFYREKEHGFRTIQKPGGLIMPAIIHDGIESLPPQVQSIQSVDLHEYTLFHLQHGTPDALELEKLIRHWAPDIAKCVRSAPPYEDRWEEPLADQFLETFYREAKRQRHPTWSRR